MRQRTIAGRRASAPQLLAQMGRICDTRVRMNTEIITGMEENTVP